MLETPLTPIPLCISHHPCLLIADRELAATRAFIQSLEAGAYARPCALASGGTVGKHARHLIDHFAAVIGGASTPGGVVDYDHRERGVPMETQPEQALEAIDRLRHRLVGLAAASIDAPVTVLHMLDADGRTLLLKSTFAREIIFAAQHALHHQATMRAIAGVFGCGTPPDFGVAPATLHHQQSLTPSPAA